MREICIELDPETVAALESEGDQIGVSSAGEYLQWLVEHRDAMPESPDRDHLLEAYRERFVDMKRELEDARSAETDEGGAPAADESSAAPDTAAPEETDSAIDDSSAADESPTPAPSQPTESERPAAAPGPSASDQSTRAEAKTDGGSPQAVAAPSGPTMELQGGPKTTTSETAPSDSEPVPSTADSEESTDAEHTQSTLEDPSAAFSSFNLTPERVTRIESDPVSEDATVLGSVETDRVDELSRRAVAQTRKQLKRNPETGLEYSSTTELSNSSIRLGEDIVDIDHLSVPSRSGDQAAQRREVAGRAVAFLRDQRRAQKSDFIEALYQEYPAGYDSADSWWRFVKASLEQVEAIDGGRVWTFSD